MHAYLYFQEAYPRQRILFHGMILKATVASIPRLETFI